jgi:hypothetical protein
MTISRLKPFYVWRQPPASRGCLDGRSPSLWPAISAVESRERLGNARRVRLLRVARIYRVQPDACNSRCFLHQVVGDLGAFPGHYRTGGQGETQCICLILEI